MDAMASGLPWQWCSVALGRVVTPWVVIEPNESLLGNPRAAGAKIAVPTPPGRGFCRWFVTAIRRHTTYDGGGVCLDVAVIFSQYLDARSHQHDGVSVTCAPQARHMRATSASPARQRHRRVEVTGASTSQARHRRIDVTGASTAQARPDRRHRRVTGSSTSQALTPQARHGRVTCRDCTVGQPSARGGAFFAPPWLIELVPSSSFELVPPT